MAYFKITKGLDIPLKGAPVQRVEICSDVDRCALLGVDYRGLKPILEVNVGDTVRRGDLLFRDRRFPEISFTAPMGGEVEAINRGEKRVLLSVVIKKSGSEQQKEFLSGGVGSVSGIETMPVDDLRKALFDSGLWTALRQRPYGTMANPSGKPTSIFVTAMDTNPLATNPEVVINLHPKQFEAGLAVLGRLTEGPVHVCQAPGVSIPHGKSPKVVHHVFEGPHPAGNVGTHIHFIDPVNASREVWHIGYQDAIALGFLFLEGKLFVDRYAALGGSQVKNPRLIKTRLGADLDRLCQGELFDAENRIVSGSPIYGTAAEGPLAFLGRFSNGISVLPEDRSRHFQGFLSPGFDKFSAKPTFLSSFFPDKSFALGTNKQGSVRDVVPIGSYEQVMPLDIVPTFLVKALLSGDLERMEQLGALELDGEDMALCTFVCPGKNEISQALETHLPKLQKEFT